MSQNTLKAMLKAWEKGKEESTVKLPTRFYELRKRRTPIPRHSIGGMTPEGEALMARDLGLDEERAKEKVVELQDEET
jgi:hypothetical protein